MDDFISRQAAIEAISSMFAPTPTQKDMVEDCLEIIENLPSAQPEPLTDKEQRIFLSAMSREEKVSKQVGEEGRDCREAYEDSLVKTYHEIIRKVKGALWT